MHACAHRLPCCADALRVQVRGEKALKILEQGLKVKEYELKRRNFSSTGAFLPRPLHRHSCAVCSACAVACTREHAR